MGWATGLFCCDESVRVMKMWARDISTVQPALDYCAARRPAENSYFLNNDPPARLAQPKHKPLFCNIQLVLPTSILILNSNAAPFRDIWGIFRKVWKCIKWIISVCVEIIFVSIFKIYHGAPILYCTTTD